MKLFDRVKINIHHLEDEESYEHMISYNNKSGTIMNIFKVINYESKIMSSSKMSVVN
ncbi:MAG: hypothetical protein KC589_06955 [Nanoarchaeota archaeon]|nr:hypothetical protein [Nanoarchaeota archaeon]